MCGLTGVFSSYVTEKHKKAFKELLWSSSVRGFDATGIIQVTASYSPNVKDKRSNCQTNTLKCTGPVPVLMAAKEFHTLVNDRDVKALFGHCRAGTIGENSFANAHPFEFETVIGMHNGTLYGDYPFKRDYQTDSESLYRAINDFGVKEAIPQAEGAWALSWFDKTNSTINFLRNKERDLWFANEKHNDTVFWASEPGLLRWILNRNGIEIDQLVQLSPDNLIAFDLLEYQPAKSIVVTKGIKRKEREVTRHVVPFLETSHISPHSTEPVNDHHRDGAKGAVITLPRGRVAFTRNGTTSSEQLYIGFNKKKLTIPELKEALESGCVYCGHQPKLGEPVKWINEEEFFCKKCKELSIFNYKDSNRQDDLIICN